jgi:hypothetical protein
MLIDTFSKSATGGMARENSSGISRLIESVEALGRSTCDWTRGTKSKPYLTCSGSIIVN